MSRPHNFTWKVEFHRHTDPETFSRFQDQVAPTPTVLDAVRLMKARRVSSEDVHLLFAPKIKDSSCLY